MGVDDGLLDKLRKIKAMVDGAVTEGEAVAAALAFQRLLDKGGVSAADVSALLDDEVEGFSAAFEIAHTNSRISYFANILAAAVAKNFRCIVAIDRQEARPRIIFYGEEKDATIAKHTYTALKGAGECLFTRYRKGHPSAYLPDLRAGYYKGFVLGVSAAFESQASEMSIMLVRDRQVDEYYENATCGLAKSKRRPHTSYCQSRDDRQGAFAAGELDGKAVAGQRTMEGLF